MPLKRSRRLKKKRTKRVLIKRTKRVSKSKSKSNVRGKTRKKSKKGGSLGDLHHAVLWDPTNGHRIPTNPICRGYECYEYPKTVKVNVIPIPMISKSDRVVMREMKATTGIPKKPNVYWPARYQQAVSVTATEAPQTTETDRVAGQEEATSVAAEEAATTEKSERVEYPAVSWPGINSRGLDWAKINQHTQNLNETIQGVRDNMKNKQ
jgi:hypothetical protein